MNIDYQNMTDQQMKTINEYLKNNMKKLKQVCYFVWGKNNIEQSYHDDLYDDAMEVLVESVIRFNPDGDAKFNTYLTNNIRKSYIEWYRDNFLRAKRNNLELDENGKIKRDENGKPIIISNLSLDAPTEDGINHHERIASDFDIDDELKLNVNDDKVNIFMNSLSKLQRKILMLKMEKYSAQQVKDIHYSKYKNEMQLFLDLEYAHIIEDYLKNGKEIINEKLLNSKVNIGKLLSEFQQLKIKLKNTELKKLQSYNSTSNIFKQSQIVKKSYDISLQEILSIHNWKLIFRASEHSFLSKSFHQICDSYANTMIIVQSKDGLIFSGYTTKTWKCEYPNDFICMFAFVEYI